MNEINKLKEMINDYYKFEITQETDCISSVPNMFCILYCIEFINLIKDKNSIQHIKKICILNEGGIRITSEKDNEIENLEIHNSGRVFLTKKIEIFNYKNVN